MAINSRRKGSKGENNAAKLLKAWTGKSFARTPSSGGLGWKATNTKGDIVCTEEGHYFPFCVEVKNHKEINFEQLLLPVKHRKIMEFWEQCTRDAKEAKKIPLLMMRYNGMPKGMHFIVMYLLDWGILAGTTEEKESAFVFGNGKDLNKSIVIAMQTLLFNKPYKIIKKKAKTHLKSKYGTR